MIVRLQWISRDYFIEITIQLLEQVCSLAYFGNHFLPIMAHFDMSITGRNSTPAL